MARIETTVRLEIVMRPMIAQRDVDQFELIMRAIDSPSRLNTSDRARISNFNVAMRRFGGSELTGNDLQKIRSELLDWSQEELGAEWGITRNAVSRMEKMKVVDVRTRDAYRSLMLRHFLAQ